MTEETKKLIKEIKEYYNVNDLSELNKDQWAEVSGFDGNWQYRLNEEFIEKHTDKIDWKLISRYQKLSEAFIEKHADKVNWEFISLFQKLTPEFVSRHKDRLDWEVISMLQKLSEPFMEKHAGKLNWNDISRYQSLSLKFIKKHSDKINYVQLFYNEYLNIKEKINNINKYPEWADIILKIYKNDLYYIMIFLKAV